MPEKLIDLYSDTKSLPTDGMRAAMMAAVVGDEQKDEDPTTLALCSRVASLLGKEAAILVPSGTMANQIALQVHCRPADEIICDRTAHVGLFEGGGPAANAGVMIHHLEGTNGVYTAKQLATAIARPVTRYMPNTKLVWVEQTANLAGGIVWPLETIQEVTAMAKNNGLATHMDGARLMNAVVATGIPAKAYAEGFDSVWIDLTKGLGCPMGAVLAGSSEFVQQAVRVKQRMGGALRQSGFIAAAGIYALDHHVERLAEDHENAKFLADGLGKIPGLEVYREKVMTNIVFFDVAGTGYTAADLVLLFEAQGVGMGAFGDTLIRMVTYINVSRADIVAALDIMHILLKQD